MTATAGRKIISDLKTTKAARPGLLAAAQEEAYEALTDEQKLYLKNMAQYRAECRRTGRKY